MTNAERIRTMKDNELADFIIYGCMGVENRMEKTEVVEWLRQEDSIPRMPEAVAEELKEE